MNSSFHAKSSIPEDFTQISLVLERTACIESEIDRQPYLEVWLLHENILLKLWFFIILHALWKS